MNDRQRRAFDKAFNLMVVELNKSGKPPNEIGREVGISRDMVRHWIRESPPIEVTSFSGDGKPVLTPEQREIAELTFKEAHIERDILKKSVIQYPWSPDMAGPRVDLEFPGS